MRGNPRENRTALTCSATLLLLALLVWASPSHAATVRLRHVNPDFAGREGDAAASPIDWSYLRGAKVREGWFHSLRAADGRGEALPSAYDLSALGRTPPVRSQRRWGTCWAFAATEAAESALLSETGVYHNLSELHLAYFAYSFEGEDKPGFTRHVKVYDPEDEDAELDNAIFDNGGLPMQVMAMYSRGTGPALESDAPYPIWLDDADDLTWANYIPPAPYAPARFRLKGAYVFHDTGEIKAALTAIGGLAIAFTSAGGRYLHDGKNFYTSDAGIEGDHAVLLIGWDDDYPRENFLSSTDQVPQRDGAWKIQNSWGEQHGDGGYYWISYEDTSLFSDETYDNGAVGYLMEPVDAYDGIYFHDPLGASGIVSLDDGRAVRMSNAFAARRDESLVSVGFFTGNVNIAYEIQVYRDIPEGGAPDEGRPVWDVPQKGRTGPRGYYAVALDEAVPLDKDERFAVEVKLVADDETYPRDVAYATVEMMIHGETDNVAVMPEQSYLYLDGEWRDTYGIVLDASDFDNYSPRNFNLNVKAFTKAREASWSGSGGGCDAGAPLLLLALAGAALFARGKR